MNRREFTKGLATSVLVPSLISLPSKAKLPTKVKYRGFDIEVSDANYFSSVAKQVYWSNGKYHNAIYVDDSRQSWEKIETAVKKNIDRFYKKELA